MEERIIIRSEVSNVIKRISRTILIIGWAISILIGVLCGLIVIATDGIWGIFILFNIGVLYTKFIFTH